MLRVEASNLPKPRGTPRARRLLPLPPLPRRGQVTSRQELLPPPNDAHPPTVERATPAAPIVAARPERWSVRLELADNEIAKLYGQGMTRGAVVWKKGMVEWRPLLITPELSGVLHRTRVTTLTESPAATPSAPLALAPPVDELTLPRPARLPNFETDAPPRKPTIVTIAPTALDVEAPPPKRGRPIELVAVAAAAFALAWIGHSKLQSPSAAVTPAATTVVAAAPACDQAPSATVLTSSTSSTIPTIAVADLPLAGAASAAGTSAPTRAGASHSRARATNAGGGAPNRTELVSALSQVASAASGCGERGGAVRVVVTFANSGVARSIQVSGTDLPASTRSCIIGATSRARIPAFAGDPVTVSKTL